MFPTAAFLGLAAAGAAKPKCPGYKTCPTPDDFPLPFNGTYPTDYPFVLGRKFPDGFTWGLGTASYQIEGAYNEGGRGASIWDTFSGANTVGMPGSVCKKAPCAVSSVMKTPGATGNVANNHYHLYKRDVQMMKDLGLKTYRFSIAWPRIVPTGRFEDGVNQEAVKFYMDLIDELINADIEPVITMFHWDLPQGLMAANYDEVLPACDSKYRQGWYECKWDDNGLPQPVGLGSDIVREFANYAEFIMKTYPHVKTWVTFNEPWTFTFLASGSGKAPSVQPYMNKTLWPYVAGHNVIISHVKAVERFHELQKQGILSKEHTIGITNNQDWREPATPRPQDIAAAEVALEGGLAWFADPIYGLNGVHDYPETMKLAMPYMPSFSKEEKALLKANRPDFFGLNHYGTGFVNTDVSNTMEDGFAMAKSTWLYSAGWGYRKLLNWVANRYGKELPIISTEGGWSVEAKTSLEGKYDPGRVMYYYQYLTQAWKAIHEDGVNLRGYFAWSLMDNYEWELGYSERFGVSWTDFMFGTDTNSPNVDTPVYDADAGKISGKCGNKCILGNGNLASQPDPAMAMNQTRHSKNALMYLQWVWQSNHVVNPARFLAGGIGGDVCWGEGTYDSADGATIACHYKHDEAPGRVPLKYYGCADAYTPCGGSHRKTEDVACCDPSAVCTRVGGRISMCLSPSEALGVVV